MQIDPPEIWLPTFLYAEPSTREDLAGWAVLFCRSFSGCIVGCITQLPGTKAVYGSMGPPPLSWKRKRERAEVWVEAELEAVRVGRVEVA